MLLTIKFANAEDADWASKIIERHCSGHHLITNGGCFASILITALSRASIVPQPEKAALTKQQIIGSDLPQFNATAPKAPRAKVKALYAFTFTTGGFNHIWAFTKAGAIEQARKELPTMASQIDRRSFKRIVGAKAQKEYFRSTRTD